MKMYKSIANLHVEDTGQVGAWNSFLKINKQENTQSQSGGTIDKIRISYILRDRTTGNASSGSCGALFAASINDTLSATPSANNNVIMASSASRLGGGVVTLNLDKYKVRDNAEDLGRKDGPIWLFVKTTDLDSTDNTELELIVETHGRWITTQAL